MKLVILAFICLGIALAEDRVSYEGYKVYQVTPKTEEEASFLHELQEDPNLDFWVEPRALNVPVSIMVTPDAQVGFENYLNGLNIDFSVLIENVESTIQAENTRQRGTPRIVPGSISFTAFLRHGEINLYLRELAQTYPNLVSLITLGYSYEGRELLAIKISSGGSPKPTIFIDAGIHAREWIAPPAALYVIQQLVENSVQNAELIRSIDWVIIPVLNPDGYEFTHTNNRLWRKTRSPGLICTGTDPNRNFDYYWMYAGASSNQCSEVYAGSEPFSEVETQALRDYLLENREYVKLYLTIHSYGQYILYPWGYTTDLPFDNVELFALGTAAGEAIASVAGTRYTVGTSTNVLYAAAGGSDDYVKAVAGVELSYCLELPGGGSTGFDIPASRILPVVIETFEGIKVYHTHIQNKFAGGL